jgi:hypothetical protein
MLGIPLRYLLTHPVIGVADLLVDPIEAWTTFDLFVHDRMHSERNVPFELEPVWPFLGQDGAIAVDDVDAKWRFPSFTARCRSDLDDWHHRAAPP